MFGMYLKPFWSVAGFKISCWTFLCDYFCLYVPGTLIDKSCLHKLHVTIFSIFLTPTPCVDRFYTLSVAVQEKQTFFDPLPPHLVHVVIEWPLES